VATVSLALSAIAAAHRSAVHTLDTRARKIRVAMKGIRKTYAAPQGQAEALKPAMVRGVLATLDDSPIEHRDGALLALLFAAALRRSELAGLDYEQAGDGDGYLRLTTEAVEIVLLRSKARTEPATVSPAREQPRPRRRTGALDRHRQHQTR
jgi:site-specific recombinase XerC